MIYQDEDFLQLSGLQHFKFCRRQWALIHVEKQWAENYRTTDGAIMHENAHDGSFTESRGDLVITRDMRVFSRTLGVSGACDVLEFRRGETGIPLKDGLTGLEVLYVNPGSAADRAGIREGDYILSAGGELTHSSQDLLRVRRYLYIGDTLTMELMRDGKRLEVTLELTDAVES